MHLFSKITKFSKCYSDPSNAWIWLKFQYTKCPYILYNFCFYGFLEKATGKEKNALKVVTFKKTPCRAMSKRAFIFASVS